MAPYLPIASHHSRACMVPKWPHLAARCVSHVHDKDDPEGDLQNPLAAGFHS